MPELSMDETYSRDYRAKRRFDDVARAIDALLRDEDAEYWLDREEKALEDARARCQNTSDSIVRRWD